MMFHYAVLTALGPREVLRVLGLNDDGSPARPARARAAPRGEARAVRPIMDAPGLAHAR